MYTFICFWYLYVYNTIYIYIYIYINLGRGGVLDEVVELTNASHESICIYIGIYGTQGIGWAAGVPRQ